MPLLENMIATLLIVGMLLVALFNIEYIITAQVSITEFIYGKDSWLAKWQRKYSLSKGNLWLSRLMLVGGMIYFIAAFWMRR